MYLSNQPHFQQNPAIQITVRTQMYLDSHIQACRDTWICSTAEKCVLMGRGREGRYTYCLTAEGNARSKGTFQISGNHFPYLGQGNHLSHILWACYFCTDQLSHWAETRCFLGFVFLKIILKKTLMPIPTLKALHRSGHLFLNWEGEERKLDKNTLP